MNPMELSPVEIAAPVYTGGKAVAIGGHLAGAEVRLFRYPGGSGAPQQIGSVVAPLMQVFNLCVEEIHYGDHVFATQHMQVGPHALASQPSKILVAQIPSKPLRAPFIATPMYAAAGKVLVGNIVNGAMVEVFVNGQSVARGAIGFPSCAFSVPPLSADDQVFVRQWFTDVAPSQSATETVIPYPDPQLAKPGVCTPLIECAPSFEVEGLVPGATVLVYEVSNGDRLIAEKVAEGYRMSVESPAQGGLQRDWVLAAEQQLCGPGDRSPRSDDVDVDDIAACFGTYPPKLLNPKPGDPFVVVEGVHESTIRITADGVDIGGGTCFGVTAFNLAKPLPAEEIQAIQSFDCRARVWEVPSRVFRAHPDDEVIELGEADFYPLVLNSSLPVMVELWATWCGVCAKIIPNMKQIAKDYAGRAVIAKLDIGVFNPVQTNSVPDFLFYKGGKLVQDVVGWNELLVRSQLDKLV